jgi:hypothetical protein
MSPEVTMMRIRYTLASVFALAMLSVGPASAQTFTAAPNLSFFLDFDSEDGNYSVWRATDLSGVNALRAHSTFVRKGQHERYAPSFSIAIGRESAEARLQVTALPRSGPLIVRASRHEGGQTTQEQMFLLTPEFRETFDLNVEWTPEGVVTFTVYSNAAQAVNGFERHQINLGGSPTLVEVSGSTGEVSFDPIELGSVTR